VDHVTTVKNKWPATAEKWHFHRTQTGVLEHVEWLFGVKQRHPDGDANHLS